MELQPGVRHDHAVGRIERAAREIRLAFERQFTNRHRAAGDRQPRPCGNLQFIGRRDGQVKIRGFRVELTEVEEVIRRFPGISDATVAAFDAPSGGKFIAAYIVSNEKIDIGELSDFIREIKPLSFK